MLGITALALLVTTCFAALGIGSESDAAGLLLALVAVFFAIGLVAAVIAGLVALVRVFRSTPSEEAAIQRGQLAQPVPDGDVNRPTFGQSFLIVVAGIVLFSGMCFAIVNEGNRGGAASAAFYLLLVGGIVAAGVGFGFMWMRAFKPRASTPSEPPA